MPKIEKGVSANTLKTIAIVAMFIDHFAWSFVATDSILGQALHFIGRFTGPTMCYFIAEGYRHTRSEKKYLLRLVIFAIISVIPFNFYNTGEISFTSMGMIYTLALGLTAIIAYEKISHPLLRNLAIGGLALLSLFGDWQIFGVVMCLIFHIYHDDFKEQLISIGINLAILYLLTFSMRGITPQTILGNICHLGMLVPVFALRFYNGQRGGNKWSGWFFYLFYPAHLLLLGWLKFYN